MKGGLRQPAQRTAVQLRPHQQTRRRRWRQASPWYIATGETTRGGAGREEARPSAATACWAARPRHSDDSTSFGIPVSNLGSVEQGLKRFYTMLPLVVALRGGYRQQAEQTNVVAGNG
jgi:hypothetical protein